MDMVSYKRKEGSKVKYIRTKDGIYQYGTGGQPKPPYYCVPNYDGTILLTSEGLARGYPIVEHTIVKQADTIEELCDRFVIEFKHGKKQPSVYRDDFYTLEEVYAFVNEYSGRCTVVSIKGAIWTDKGLIYVAKMNEKGELELL